MKFDAREKKIYQRLAKLCLSLPATDERMSWDHPNWRVGGKSGKIFAAFAPGHGGLHIAFKARSRAVLDPPRVIEAPGWGKYGWVLRMIGDEETVATLDWDEIEEWLRESWELVAPKKLRSREQGPRRGHRDREGARAGAGKGRGQRDRSGSGVQSGKLDCRGWGSNRDCRGRSPSSRKTR